MARKPKTARTNDFANSPEGVLAALGDAPAPARRGRKPKVAAAPEPLVTSNSDDAAGGTADADGTIADPVAPPARKRPGPKPKGRAGATEAAPLQAEAGTKPGQEAQAPGAAPKPGSAADSKPDAGTDSQQDQQQPRGPELATPEPAPASATSNAAPPLSSQDAAPATQPAAQWDRATDTVRFDWAAIERTASQGGPNQVMARLLVAARAEGANSRWPL